MVTLTKLASPEWWKNAVSSRIRDRVNSIAFTPFVRQREVAGERHAFYIGNPTGKTWYNSPFYDCQEMRFVKNHLLKPGAIVFECGAHHGEHTILLSRWVGSTGKVIAIDPVPENVEIIRKNIELNHLTNVTLFENAAGNDCRTVSMHQRSNSAVTTGGRHTRNVECITLDSLADRLGIMPTIVKIDVEGFEYQVLEGCQTILATGPTLCVEIHALNLQRYGKTFSDLWKLVDRDRYDIFFQDNDHVPVPYTSDMVPKDWAHMFFKPKQTNSHMFFKPKQTN